MGLDTKSLQFENVTHFINTYAQHVFILKFTKYTVEDIEHIERVARFEISD